MVKVEKVTKKKTDGVRYILNCSECHGFDGNSADPQWPNIAGLNKDYISRQLQDFKSGKRVNKEMTTIVREFPSDACSHVKRCKWHIVPLKIITTISICIMEVFLKPVLQ